MRVELDFTPNLCDDGKADYSKFVWLDALIILLAIASFTLEIMQLLETFNTMRKLREFFYQNGNASESKNAAAN